MASRWSNLSPAQQRSVVALGAVQISLATVAWLDLARRPTAQVNGRKGMWAAIIAINWIGPIAYFVKGVAGDADEQHKEQGTRPCTGDHGRVAPRFVDSGALLHTAMK